MSKGSLCWLYGFAQKWSYVHAYNIMSVCDIECVWYECVYDIMGVFDIMNVCVCDIMSVCVILWVYV